MLMSDDQHGLRRVAMLQRRRSRSFGRLSYHAPRYDETRLGYPSGVGLHVPGDYGA